LSTLFFHLILIYCFIQLNSEINITSQSGADAAVNNSISESEKLVGGAGGGTIFSAIIAGSTEGGAVYLGGGAVYYDPLLQVSVALYTLGKLREGKPKCRLHIEAESV
jgi:hypothetical protein